MLSNRYIIFLAVKVLKPYVTWSWISQGYEFKTIEGAIEH
jgi:hypothetical protein